ncbi:MAG: GntR family transcriptional regulator [Eggerthellaceae bacterium]|nr:GntR family transcriptional regulator [Eggerthellaceae bacterium]
MAQKAVPKFEIDESSSLPLWVQLRDRFAFLISTGFYEPGEQLPSVRKFAAENHVSLNTVSKAFMALEREGYIVTRHGSGAYVRETTPDDVALSEIDVITDEYIKNCLELGMGYEDIPAFIRKAIERVKSQAPTSPGGKA